MSAPPVLPVPSNPGERPELIRHLASIRGIKCADDAGSRRVIAEDATLTR